MQTKITLTIHGAETEIRPECIRNWGDILCVYKRSDFSGVVRSFTSKFDFVNEAYDALLCLYISDGFGAEASVSIYTKNNDWYYRKRFECPLDFTSVQIQDRVLSISALDNSLSALIKANKSTKYEFVSGTDILSDKTFHFDRLPMMEAVTYAFTNGSSSGESGTLYVEHSADQPEIWMGSVANEVSINQAVYWQDDQKDDPDSYAIQAVKDIDIEFDFSAVCDRRGNSGAAISLYVEQTNRTGIEQKDTYSAGSYGGFGLREKYLGEFARPSDLPVLTGGIDDDGKYAIIGGIVYEARYQGTQTLAWFDTGMDEDEFAKGTQSGRHTFHLSNGDRLRFRVLGAGNDLARFSVISSNFKFKWTGRGDAFDTPAYSPIRVLQALLDRIVEGKVDVVGEIRDNPDDNRLQRIAIMAAEDIRGIDGAKLYTSFSDFADWMETVFGYTYYIDDTEEIAKVVFMHRSALFRPDAHVKRIDDAVDAKYSVNVSSIYSTIEIGYDKKDYDGVNGRDEFNFNSTYTTGLAINEKKLSLISKYRADCYGIEFAAQKRGATTTDTSSDNDVFFVVCRWTGNNGKADRTTPIEGALSDQLFNGEVSPLHCLRANAGYIGMQSNRLRLAFASSKGNTSISIGSEPLDSDVTLDSPLMTVGELEFMTNDLDTPTSDSLVSVSVDGISYEGYISEVEESYSRENPAKYIIMIKSMRT